MMFFFDSFWDNKLEKLKQHVENKRPKGSR
jgi:hypothetical protein